MLLERAVYNNHLTLPCVIVLSNETLEDIRVRYNDQSSPHSARQTKKSMGDTSLFSLLDKILLPQSAQLGRMLH